MRPQRVGLKYQPQVALLRRDFATRVAVIDAGFTNGDNAAGRLLQPGDRPQQRGFSAARWPEQRHHLSPLQFH